MIIQASTTIQQPSNLHANFNNVDQPHSWSWLRWKEISDIHHIQIKDRSKHANSKQ
uniref:Uncharacterized protein n=1 Tax=Arundo donax TaxID=35708 RepID=A0A0A9CRW1_ARUDO